MKWITATPAILLFFFTSIFGEAVNINIQHWELPNKTTVFFVQRNQLPMLDCELIFHAGSSRDGQFPGLSVLTNAMLGDDASQFERVGAQFSAFSDRDKAGFSLRTRVNPAVLSATIHDFSNRIQSSTFSETTLARIKQQLLSQLKLQAQDPSEIASNVFYKSIYENHFYAHNPLGDKKSIGLITPTLLKNFYKKYYVGSNANLILVGDISLSQAKIIATEIAGKLSMGEPAPVLSEAEKTKESKTEHIAFSSTQSTIIIGDVGITRQNPDYFPLLVGNAILGGNSMSSILYNEIREKRGLAYTITSMFHPLAYRGPFLIYLQTKSSYADQANELIKKILRKFIDEGPTTQELNAAKKSLIAGFPLSLTSNAAILSTVSNIAFYHRPLNYLNTYSKNIESVNIEEVKKAFNKQFGQEKLVTVMVGYAGRK